MSGPLPPSGSRLPGLMELRSLRARLAARPGAELAQAWPGLSPFEKLIWFKLLEPDRALRFFPLLSLEEQVFLLQGAELAAAAPALEAVPAARAEFHELKPWHREELLRIAREKAARGV